MVWVEANPVAPNWFKLDVGFPCHELTKDIIGQRQSYNTNLDPNCTGRTASQS